LRGPARGGGMGDGRENDKEGRWVMGEAKIIFQARDKVFPMTHYLSPITRFFLVSSLLQTRVICRKIVEE
jgi:hypothetical protein